MAIKLGWKVRDTITGFTGIATARYEYLHGCVRIEVSPVELKDGKPIDAHVFDEQRVAKVEELPVETSPDSSAKTGGPFDTPTRPAPAR